MTAPSARTLRLLSLLQSHRHWSGDELAERLEVSLRTVRRDVDRLRGLGYPVRATPGVDGGYQLEPGAVLPPLLLDDDEAVAIAVGLDLAAHASVTGIDESSVRALSKLAGVMPRRLTAQVEAIRAATVTLTYAATSTVATEVLTRLAQLCRDHERARFDYVAADGKASHRTVEPLHLVRLGQRWYVVAYDLDRHDWRSFRLDRLRAPSGTGETFRPRALPTADAAEFVRSRMGVSSAYDVEAVVHAPADEVQALVGRWSQVEPRDETSCTVRMTTDALPWAALVLGTCGAVFDVVAPPALHELVADWAARFADAAQRSG
ncbi:MAG: YafY family protein [Candidatus Nanopelagicales bacterium]